MDGMRHGYGEFTERNGLGKVESSRCADDDPLVTRDCRQHCWDV